MPHIASFEAGLLPVKRISDGEMLLVIKAPKEVLLAAKINKGFRIYLVPITHERGEGFGIVSAFFDDEDEPLTLATPLFDADEMTVDIAALLTQETFDVHFFDEHNRELLGYHAVNGMRSTFANTVATAVFPVFSFPMAREVHASMTDWFSRRTVVDDDGALEIKFRDALFPDDIMITDLRPQANSYHGYKTPMTTFLERVEPGDFQELDIVNLLQRVFPSDQIILNPTRPDDGKEFLDVMVASAENILLFQVKDSPNTPTILKRSMKRKMGTVVGQLHKAVRQMKGSFSYCQSSEILHIVTGKQHHRIPLTNRTVRGVIVMKELFSTEYADYSEPVLALAREMRFPCIVMDYPLLHGFTHHLRSEDEIIDAYSAIFSEGLRSGVFPRLRFGLIDR